MGKDIKDLLEVMGTIRYVCRNCMGGAGIKTIDELTQFAISSIENLDTTFELPERNKLPQPSFFTIKEGGDWIEWHNRGFSNTKHAHAIKFDDGSIFDMVNGWRGDVGLLQAIHDDIICEDEGCPHYGTPHLHTDLLREPQTEIEKLVSRHTGDTKNMLFGALEKGQDKPSIPDCAYFNKYDGRFHSRVSGEYMGDAFQERWISRANEFAHIPSYYESKIVNHDQRVVPRGLLEHVLGTLEEIHNRPVDAIQSNQTLDDVRFGVEQLKAALAIEKKELKPDNANSNVAKRTCRLSEIS